MIILFRTPYWLWLLTLLAVLLWWLGRRSRTPRAALLLRGLITQGVQLTGLLPAPHELTTVYTAAVARDALEPQLARELIAALSSSQQADTRRASGFVDAA